jgi:L-ornithine Nalpha-acyltransferase
MTIAFHKGSYTARLAQSAQDVQACQALRHECFFGTKGRDCDAFDPLCQHLMISDSAQRLVAAARFSIMPNGAGLRDSYAGQFYDLSGLARDPRPVLELGRFCIAADVLDADVVRIAWGALTQIVDGAGVGLLVGCTSFAGTDPARYGRAFARLAAQNVGPADLRPAIKAPQVVHLAAALGQGDAPLPSLLRSYLAMGGWVSDHAVIDHQMQTLHVFTCLDIAAVPPARARALRAVMGA